MWKRTQHSFVGGMLDRDLMGRQDLQKYFQGATTLENFLVKRQGGIGKRRGTELQARLKNLLGGKITYTPDIKLEEIPKYTLSEVQDKCEALGWTVDQVLESNDTYYIIRTSEGGDAIGMYTGVGDVASAVTATGEFEDNGAYVDLDNATILDRNLRVQATFDDGEWVMTQKAVTSMNTITSARLFPFVYERNEGYYLLITASYLFIVGDQGVMLNDGSFVKNIPDYDYEDDVNNLDAPFHLAVGYSDEHIESLKIAQSGDTVFFLHKSYPVKQFLFNKQYSTIKNTNFSASVENQPTIESVTKTGVDGGSSGASKTIEYCITAVVDGVESIPSTPFAVTYKLPWAAGGRFTIKAAETIPNVQYYNVYKKSGGDFALIGSTSSASYVVETPLPTIEAKDEQIWYLLVGNDICWTHNLIHTTVGWDSVSKMQLFAPAYINNLETPSSIEPFSDSVLQASWEKSDIYFCGLYGKPFFFPSGEHASYIEFQYNDGGRVIDAIQLKTGSYVASHDIGIGKGYSITWYAKIIPSRAQVYKATVTFADGTSKTITSDVYPLMPLPEGWTDYNLVYMSPAQSKGDELITESMVNKVLPSPPPIIDLEINPVGTDFANKKKVVKVRITGYSDTAGTIPCAIAGDYPATGDTPMVLSKIALIQYGAQSKEFEDDNITPDFSVTPPQKDDHFNKSGEYPSCGAFHQQRFCVASTDKDPFTFWMSCVGDIYNFGTHSSIREDDAINATLSATKFPRINHLIINKDLMALCDSGEWVIAPVSGNTLSYKTVSAKQQSALGCSPTIEPLSIGDEIIFANVNGEAVYATVYSFTTDGYESKEISVLSSRMFRSNPIKNFCFKQFPDSEVLCVLADGTVAALVYMKEHEVCAWSHCTLGGGYLAKSISCNEAIDYGTSEASILVCGDDGNYELWKIRPDKPFATLRDAICMDGMEYLSGEELVERWDDIPDGMDVYDLLNGNKVDSVDDIRLTNTYVIGYPFIAKFVSVYPEPEGNETIQYEIKEAQNAEVRITNGSSFKVYPNSVSEDKYKVDYEAEVSIDSATGSVTLADCDLKRVLVGSNNRDGRIVLEHVGVLPLTILSISTEYQIEIEYTEGR